MSKKCKNWSNRENSGPRADMASGGRAGPDSDTETEDPQLGTRLRVCHLLGLYQLIKLLTRQIPQFQRRFAQA